MLQGWRLMAPHFKNLIESAIFPTLTLKNKVSLVVWLRVIKWTVYYSECPWESLLLGAIKDMRHLINVQDVLEWEEDEDEYVRKNLPSELVGFLGTTIIIRTYVVIWCVVTSIVAYNQPSTSLVVVCEFGQDNPSGWKEDLFTARQSALNLLGLIATSKVVAFGLLIWHLFQSYSFFLLGIMKSFDFLLKWTFNYSLCFWGRGDACVS